MTIVNFPGSVDITTGSFSLSAENITFFTSAFKSIDDDLRSSPRKALVRCIKPRETDNNHSNIFLWALDYSQLFINENVQ